jgi:Tol biopolymer transport system component
MTVPARNDERSALAPGIRLGPYEVLASLGAGGMGEVYRARDERLGREVAVKVLHAESSADPDRIRRFEQEARAAGALNHPNVLVVFDTGEHEGAPFVVFELLEGETVRARLAGKGLSPPKALDYAIQIARGLAAAHEKGIVHRDLKPENLFLTRDGRIKILDFGVAKLRPPLDPGTIGVETPTASVLSEAGKVLGTVGYMSPEQVRRSPVDHRSDIFSFGSVLYELLAGKRAFVGGSEAETMAAIVNVDPPPLTGANGKLPGAYERIVRHCLEKRPDDRFQSARDLVFDLESLAAAPGGLAVEGAKTSRSRRQLPALLAAAGLGAALALTGALLNWPQAAEPLFKQVTFRRGSIAEARFAPDGQTIIYGAVVEGRHNRLFSARLGSAEVRLLDLPEGDIAGITASGEMAIILSRSYWGRVPGTLARVSHAGGAPRELLEHVSMADWGPDGTSLAVVRHDGPKPRLEFPIGKVLYVGRAWAPRVSPKGDLVAFKAAEGGSCTVKVVDLSGKATTLASAECALGLAWSPSGEEVWYTEWEIIRAVTLGGRQRVLTGFPGPVTLNDVSADGRVLVTTAQWYNGLVFAGPGDTKERDLAWFEWAILGALSRDGRSMLFSDRGSGTGPPDPRQTYLRRTDGAPAVRLGEGSALSLSPDGKWGISVILSGGAGDTRPVDRTEKCRLLPTGPGDPRPLPVGDLECEYASFFPDGQRVLVVGSEPGGPRRLFVQDLEGRSRRPLTPEGFALGEFVAVERGNFIAEASPDGKLVLATEAAGSLVLVPVDGGEPRPVPGIRPRDASAGWGADSQSLYVYSPNESDFPVRVDRIHLPSGRRELFKLITPPELAATGGVNKVRVTPDGKAYAYGYGQYPCILYVIEGLH